MVSLAGAGIGVAGYLSYTHLFELPVLCGDSQGCDLVAQSIYANMFGIPVAVFGLLTYIALLALLIARRHVSENLEAYVTLAVFGLSLLGVLFSAYLTYLELFVILAVCIWCVASAVIMAGLFVLSIWEMKSVNP
ncbi:MAG: vitamin K epoxide reductase family protein [Anaerolineae bacterium]|nr:vitamin K epoxide reductase family protein [Anaerolineae bacterium]